MTRRRDRPRPVPGSFDAEVAKLLETFGDLGEAVIKAAQQDWQRVRAAWRWAVRRLRGRG